MWLGLMCADLCWRCSSLITLCYLELLFYGSLGLGEEVIIFKRLRGSWEVVWTLVRLMFLFGFHGYESYNYSLGTIFLRSKPPFSLGGSFC